MRRAGQRQEEVQRALHPTHGDHPRKGTHKPNASSASAVAALARLLKKIDQVDPLRCPHCGSEMHLIASIEQPEVIRKILRHLGLWERPQRSPPPRLFPHKLETFTASLSPRRAQEIRGLHRFGFLGRCPGLERPKSHLSSFFIPYPCAFFSALFALISATLTLSQLQGRLCLLCSLCSPKKTALYPLFEMRYTNPDYP